MLLGCLLTFFPLYATSISQDLYAILVLIGCCLILIGIIIYSGSYKNLKRLQYLQKSSTPLLAHWIYQSPKNNPMLATLLHEKYTSALFNIVLFGLLGFVFNLGIFLSDVAHKLSVCLIFSAAILIFAGLSIRLLKQYYEKVYETPVEVMIGEECFFFLGEIYTLSYGMWFLEDIKVVSGETPYLIFSYGEKADHPHAHTVTIPIPPKELDEARAIQTHYLALISTYTQEF
jgi:hypothetical protein